MGLLKRRAVRPATGNKSILRGPVRGSLKASKGMYSSSSLSVGTPEIRDPMFTPEAFYVMNTDIKTMNKWIRYYDKYHPILPNSLDIHTLFPISDFSFKGVTDPSIKDFYDYLKNDVLFLLDWVIKISSEYERFGEAFTFFSWDSYNGYFNSAVVLNPDLLELSSFDMDGQRKFVISMDIPESFDHLMHMKDIDQRYRGLWNNLDPVIRRCVEGGLPIPLNPANVFGMQRLQSAYDTRGTSQVLRILKDLMYEDKLREAQMAVADGHITPYQIWKLGNSNAGYVPTQDEIENFSNLLNQSDHQNLFRIVTHSDVVYETKGVQDGLLNIIAEMDKIEDRILTALYTSRSMTTGEGPCVSADTEVLTLDGFKPFPEVTVEDMVASVNPETHEIEYCKPEKVLCFDVEGTMVHFQGEGLDHLVTPNHRCFIKKESGFEICIAKDVTEGSVFLAVDKEGRKSEHICSDISYPDYKGKVYSLDLPPNRIYVSRRKGRITVTGNTYSNAVIGLKVLEGRYQHKLYKISGIVRALYRKIAEVNEIYEPLTVAQSNNGIRPSKKDRKLMVPSVHWDNYFSFSKDIERAKFYLTLAQAHKVSFRRVLEILGLDFDEEQAIMQKDLKSLFETPIYEKKMKELTGDGGVGGGGVPTDLTAPPSGPMGDAGAEIPDGASAPPLPDMEDI